MPPASADGRNRLVAAATAVVAAALVIASACVAYRFGQLVGTTETERQIYSWAGVAANILKGCLPFIVFAAFANRRWLFGAFASIGLIVAVSYSLIANYSVSFSGRQASASQTDRQIELRTQLKALGNPRPPAVVEPLVGAARDLVEKRQLQSELAAGRVAEKLREQLTAPTAGAADGEESIAATLGVDPHTIRKLLAWLTVAVMELGELVGFYGASLLWGSRGPRGGGASEPPEVLARPEVDHMGVVSPVRDAPLPRAPRGSTRQFIQQYMIDASPGPVYLMDARDDYFEHMARLKKKGVGERAFARNFDQTAEAMGWVRRVDGNKVFYEKH